MALKSDHTEIELLRGGRLVSTLTGAFGQSLSETRLTALLGYLIAIEPERFLPIFGFQGVAQQVRLETRHDDGRSDILIETNQGTVIIEAKTGATDPFEQSRRYPARWHALLTHSITRQSRAKNTTYVTWQELANTLVSLSKSTSPKLRVLSTDLLAYLQEHRMVKQRESVEIYAREINEPTTLQLFLKAQLYCCQFEAGSRLTEALYFAPHFGRSIAGLHAGVNVGITYIARIQNIGHVGKWSEFEDLMVIQNGRTWWKRNLELMTNLRRTWKKDTYHTVLDLGQPRMVFNPPIKKESLQKGKGWLSKRFFSFDELFDAWGV